MQLQSAGEQYQQSIDVRNRIRALEIERDNFDAQYETSRYEDMIAFDEVDLDHQN